MKALMSDTVRLGGSLPYYRAIMVDGDGHTVSMHRIMAVGDDEAVAEAKALADGHGVDLWDGVRFVDHFPAINPSK